MPGQFSCNIVSFSRKRLTSPTNWFCRYDAAPRLCSSYSTIPNHHAETVKVQCRSNGEIELNVFASNSRRLILYLPSGPLLPVSIACDQRVIDVLVAKANATVVVLNYRVGTKTKYPTPIHDVLFGYDWIKSEIKSKNVAVCGQLLGGSLATMLSMTESHSGAVTAALNNPIVDWVVPDREALQRSIALAADALDDFEDQPFLKPKKSKRKKLEFSSWSEYKDEALLSEATLLKARAALFPNPDSFFDSFASPIHLFRTPGIDSPILTKAPVSSEDGEDPPTPQLRRKARKLYPPSDHPFSLPSVRVTTGQTSLLQSQAEELVERLTISEITRFLKRRGISLSQYAELDEASQSEIDFIREKTQEKYVIKYLPNSGLWGIEDSGWEQDLDSVIEWFDQQLPG
jgi:acetyl esterase/lipase